MIEGVMALDRIAVRELMTPRAKIIWINVHDSHEAISHRILVSGHSSFPVYDGNRDHVIGVISVKSLYGRLVSGAPVVLKDLMSPALVVAASQSASSLLERFKQTRIHVALVADEFGGIIGLVSLHDIMEAIVGDMPSPDERARPRALRRDDGSWLVDGMLEIEEFERQLPDFKLHPEGERDYQTFAGFVVKHLGRVPREGEKFQLHGYEVDVIDMDGHRVDKLTLKRLPTGNSGAKRPESMPDR
jgi:putative hemolysin